MRSISLRKMPSIDATSHCDCLDAFRLSDTLLLVKFGVREFLGAMTMI